MDFSPFLEKCRELLNEWKSSLLIGLASAIFILVLLMLPTASQSEWATSALIIACAMFSLSIASFIVKLVNLFHINRCKKKEDDAKNKTLALSKTKQINTAKLILKEMTRSQKEILRKLLSGPSKFDSYSYQRSSMREDLHFLQIRGFIILIDQLTTSKAIFQLNELFTDIVISDQHQEVVFHTEQIFLTYENEVSTLLNNFNPKNQKTKLPKSILGEKFKFENALNFYYDKVELTIRFKPHYKEVFESHLNINLNESATYELIDTE